MTDYCCKPDSGECCGPGSWCCSHAGEHDHDVVDWPPGMWDKSDYEGGQDEVRP